MVVPWEYSLREDEVVAYEREVRGFLSSPTTTRAAVTAGRGFHRAAIKISQPVFGPASSSTRDELQERISLAKQAQQIIRHETEGQSGDVERLRVFRMNLMQFSAFLCSDLDTLREGVNITSGAILFRNLEMIESLLAHCKYFRSAHCVLLFSVGAAYQR